MTSTFSFEFQIGGSDHAIHKTSLCVANIGDYEIFS